MSSLRRHILSLSACLLLVSCFNEVSYRTQYVLEPWIEPTSGGTQVAPYGTITTYAYRADTTDWTVASYEEALSMGISSRSSGETLTQPMAVGEPYTLDGNENWLIMDVEGASVMVVAVDTENRLYGYRQSAIGPNLPSTYVRVLFRPWKRASYYVDGAWQMFNDFYKAEVEYLIAPQLQTEQGGSTAACSGAVAYIFAADDSGWRPASFDQARSGVISTAAGALRSDPLATATLDPTAEDAQLRMVLDLTEGQTQGIVVMVADTDNLLYGYLWQEIDDQKATQTTQITFCPWREESSYESGNWTMCRDEQPARYGARKTNMR